MRLSRSLIKLGKKEKQELKIPFMFELGALQVKGDQIYICDSRNYIFNW